MIFLVEMRFSCARTQYLTPMPVIRLFRNDPTKETASLYVDGHWRIGEGPDEADGLDCKLKRYHVSSRSYRLPCRLEAKHFHSSSNPLRSILSWIAKKESKSFKTFKKAKFSLLKYRTGNLYTYLNLVVTVQSLFFLDSDDGRKLVVILCTGRIPEEINAVGRFRS
jgi:hypothetical protein